MDTGSSQKASQFKLRRASRIGVVCVAMVLVATLAACAADPPLMHADSKTGWVTEIYSAERLSTKVPTCLKHLSREQVLSGKYVEVSVSHFRSYRYLSALVPAGIEVKPHDKVEIYPKECKDGSIPSIVQVLKTRP